jgi:hypothetical protein
MTTSSGPGRASLLGDLLRRRQLGLGGRHEALAKVEPECGGGLARGLAHAVDDSDQ